MSEDTRLLPVEPEQFSFLFELATAAMDYRVPMSMLPRISGNSVDIPIEPGKVERVQFGSHPVIRLMEAVASQVPDPQDRTNAAGRIFHLYSLLETKDMAPWIRVLGGEKLLHPAVLGVAASHPAFIEAGFSPGFFQKIAKAVEENPAPEPELND